MNAFILSIGDELVLGQTVDANSAWLSQQLAGMGIRILAHTTVGDDQSAIENAIRLAAERSDVLLISGGLGPTEDDLTRQALAAVLGQPLETNEDALKHLTAWFRRANRPMPESNKIQAMAPRGAKLIDNSAGTAPGLDTTLSFPGSSHTCRIFIMPGVPKEMKIMFDRSIRPHLQQFGGGGVILSRTLHTFGVGESTIGEKLGSLMKRGRNPSVGTTVANGIVSLRINAYFDSREEAAKQLEATDRACREVLGDLIFGSDQQTLQEVVAELLRSINHPSVATAESCTGGLVAKMLTDVPGSSVHFQCGWVTYSNQAKEQMLGVGADLIRDNGAVSEPVAAAMARGARERAEAHFGVAISGIAGPDGGTPAKPVGTVCIALDVEQGPTLVRTFHLPGDREWIRDRSAKMALTMLRFHLLGKTMPF